MMDHVGKSATLKNWESLVPIPVTINDDNCMTLLPNGFTPTNWCVICGRGKEAYNHIGNRRFRLICEMNAQKYMSAKSKTEKSVIVMSIVDMVHERSETGGFVKYDEKTEQWFEVGVQLARDKVGQQLRESAMLLEPKKKQAQRKIQASRMQLREESGSPTTCTRSVASPVHGIQLGRRRTTWPSLETESSYQLSTHTTEDVNLFEMSELMVSDLPTGTYQSVERFSSLAEEETQHVESDECFDHNFFVLPPALMSQSSDKWFR